MDDMISKQAAIDICNSAIDLWHGQLGEGALVAVKEKIEGVPSAQLGTDCISRQAAIDALRKMQTYKLFSGDDMLLIDQAGAMTELMLLPSRTPIQELLDVTADRDYWKAQCHSYEMTINRLTESAQPEPPEECERCMMEHTDEMEKLEAELAIAKSKHPEPCEDAVNRETILKFFDGWMSALDENCHNQSVSDLKIIKRDFANLPPVMPKQRTGKWVLVGDNMTKREFLDIVFALAPTEANRIMDAFDEYVESTEPHWIPCSERLPERNGDYLCQEKLGFLYVDTWNGEYWDCADRAYRTVIAWMPLPEPYKGVTDGRD